MKDEQEKPKMPLAVRIAFGWFVLLTLVGAPPSRLGNFAMVVVRKGGAAQVIKRKYMIPKCVFSRTPYELGPDTYFLTPVGRRNLSQAPTSEDCESEAATQNVKSKENGR